MCARLGEQARDYTLGHVLLGSSETRGWVAVRAANERVLRGASNAGRKRCIKQTASAARQQTSSTTAERSI